MQSRFVNQIALITGAASGIGQATAILLAEQGAKVVVTDRDEHGIARTVEAITNKGGLAVGRPLDVTSEADWQAVVAFTEQTWSRLHILVNCAGIAIVRPIPEMTLAQWREVLAVNLDGVFLGTRAGITAMRRAGGGGSIINVSSASGIKAVAPSSAYCTSKAGVIMFSRCASLECVQAGDGIRINVVAPGGVKTPMWEKMPEVAGIMQSEEWKASIDVPIGKRFADPMEIAKVIAFLASAESSYITGSVVPIDAGYTA